MIRLILNSCIEIRRIILFFGNKDYVGLLRPGLNYRVDADKGFNYAPPDDAFVCQKKNHFQITVHLSVPGVAKFVKPVEGNVAKVDTFYLHFYGIKVNLSRLVLIN